MERFLHDLATGLKDPELALDLRPDAAFDEAKGVHVLQLRLPPELARADWAQRDVRIASQRSLLHVHVADSKLAQGRAQQLQPLARLLGRAEVGLGDDLRQRRAPAVEVDETRVGAVNPAARADVDQLRRILLQVHAVDAGLTEPARSTQ